MTKDVSRPIAWLSDCDHQRNNECSIPADINNQGSCEVHDSAAALFANPSISGNPEPCFLQSNKQVIVS